MFDTDVDDWICLCVEVEHMAQNKIITVITIMLRNLFFNSKILAAE